MEIRGTGDRAYFSFSQGRIWDVEVCLGIEIYCAYFL
jgi:hypothetical protein